MWAISKMKQLEASGGTHPDLIPYDQMSDQQKEYDRKASTDTLKCCISRRVDASHAGRFLTLCGYTFVKKQVRRQRQNDLRFASFILKFLCGAANASDGCASE